MDFVAGVIITMGFLVGVTLAMIYADPQQQHVYEPQTHDIMVAPGSGAFGCEKNNECYIPYDISIRTGDTIVWDNIDDVSHTITSITDGRPDGLFDSGLFVPKATFEVTFDEPGTYDYFCNIHPWMFGVVIVDGPK